VYEHEGELVLVWAFIPGRMQEMALLEAGFTPSAGDLAWTCDDRDPHARRTDGEAPASGTGLCLGYRAGP
jgi:hypothetical protein